MATTADVKVTEGSGKNVATYSLTEDAETKQIQRIVLNTSAGVESGTSGSPVQVSLANTASNSTAVKVDGSAVTQPTAEVAPTTVLNGKKTVTTAGTRVTLAASTTCKSVTIKALAANTGTIYVGDTSVASTNGYALAPGETVTLDIANLNTVNLDSSVNGEGVTYIGNN